MAARDDMAAYMRARRAHLKAEAEQAIASGDTRKPQGIEARRARRRAEQETTPAAPRNAVTKASAAEIAAVRAKIAAIGPSAVFTKTDGRLDVIMVAAFKARQKARSAALAPRIASQPQRHATLSPSPPTPSLGSPEPSLGSPEPSRALTVAGPTPLQGEVISPPRSMIADGGTPPRRFAKDASVAEATALIRAYAAEQARINAETARRLDALERDKAERDRRVAALEDRQACFVGFVQGIAGVFSLVARG